MDDSIFDDVDAILNEDLENAEDKNFNEDELQDIMSEIEDLEKEFVGAPTSEMSLQEQIDAELAAELSEINAAEVPESVVEEIEMEMEMEMGEAIAPAPVAKEVTLTPAPMMSVVSEIPKSENKSEVSFQAHGQMSFNLDFKVGQEVAKLVVDPVKGLMVSVSGVEFCINEDSGCTVSMENGMKFTIPLSSKANSSKKKAA